MSANQLDTLADLQLYFFSVNAPPYGLSLGNIIGPAIRIYLATFAWNDRYDFLRDLGPDSFLGSTVGQISILGPPQYRDEFKS